VRHAPEVVVQGLEDLPVRVGVAAADAGEELGDLFG
jgi:hypothetical protein